MRSVRKIRFTFFGLVALHAAFLCPRLASAGCGGEAGRGTIFNNINHIEFYAPQHLLIGHWVDGHSKPIINEIDFQNILREIVKKNFSDCFNTNYSEAISFATVAGGQTMNSDKTLVIIIRRSGIYYDAKPFGGERLGLTPDKLPSLGRAPGLLTVEMYRNGLPSNIQGDVLGQWSRSIVIPDSDDTESTRSYVVKFLETTIRPQVTYSGEDNIAEKLK